MRVKRVFTSEYLDRLSSRWSSRPERDWPLVALVALHNDREDERRRIEDYVQGLDPEDHARIARNLQSEKQFITTLGELLVGHAFVLAGVKPRYERSHQSPSGRLTPDWSVAGPSPFVCDVFTAGLSEQRDSHETALRDIVARLSAIPGGYVLRLELENASRLDPRGRKQLAAEAGRWLRSGVRTGNILSVGAATLEVFHVGGSRVEIVTTDPMHIVNTPKNLSENFEDKVKKYGSLGLALIVAAVKHPRAEVDETCVNGVLFGEEVYVSRITGSGHLIAGTERLPNAVFPDRPNLSAAMWMDPYRLPRPVLRVWANPSPSTPIPGELLAKVANVKLRIFGKRRLFAKSWMCYASFKF